MVTVLGETKPTVIVVNALLKEFFGRKVQGNLDNSDTIPLPVIDKLHMIANRRMFGFDKIIGRFDCEDGSKIRVLPIYEEQARKYAVAYERATGRETTVILDSDADTHPMCF